MYIIAIVVIIVIVLLYYRYFWAEPKSPYAVKHRAQVICFYSNRCGHCKDLMDTGKWSKVSDYFAPSSNITVSKVEEAENPELIAKYGINGFPTIRVLRDDGKVADYDEAREPAAIISFVEKFTQ